MQKLSKVVLIGLKIEMRDALMIAEEVWEEFGKELMITCGLEGIHSARSVHYYGYAVDARTRYFIFLAKKKKVRDELERRLKEIDERFDVVLEIDHMHIEFDITKTI